MATMIDCWSNSPIASNHPKAGHIRPGKNRVEDNMYHLLLNEGLVVPYKGQDKPKGETAQNKSPQATKKLRKKFGGHK